MLFTTLTLPEDVILLHERTGGRRPGGVRIDVRPPAKKLGNRSW